MSKRTITSICETLGEELHGKYFEYQRQYIIRSKHELMCCVCVQWCDTDEPLVVVVVMNNIVPPTVQTVSMADRQRAPSRGEEESVIFFW